MEVIPSGIYSRPVGPRNLLVLTNAMTVFLDLFDNILVNVMSRIDSGLRVRDNTLVWGTLK